MKVLLSIKPEFANKIFEGTKKFEFRRSIFKDRNVRTVIVYASSPVQRVIGEFEISQILTLCKEQLWELTKLHAGIEKEFFDEYFWDKDFANALEIESVSIYPNPLDLLKDFQIKTPPQSFQYIPN